MSVFTVDEARSSAARLRGVEFGLRKSAAETLREVAKAQDSARAYDIFLSHASADAELILGVTVMLRDLGYEPYVDWLEDPQLDRSHVTADTAAILRGRMNQCRSLFFATTTSSATSLWMPWECGYFDGSKGKSAILPVLAQATDLFSGQEYLGLYPYITKDPARTDDRMRLWVHRSADTYVEFEAWLEGREPGRH